MLPIASIASQSLPQFAALQMRPDMLAQEMAARAQNTISPAEMGGINGAGAANPAQAAAVPGGFGNVLEHFVHQVNDKQLQATQSVTGLLAGQNVPLHQAMIAMEEASISFQLMVEVRNKLLEGYQELMRMQV